MDSTIFPVNNLQTALNMNAHLQLKIVQLFQQKSIRFFWNDLIFISLYSKYSLTIKVAPQHWLACVLREQNVETTCLQGYVCFQRLLRVFLLGCVCVFIVVCVSVWVWIFFVNSTPAVERSTDAETEIEDYA